MTSIEGGGKREIARIRSIYCSPENRALIGRRAKEAGMSFSRFMVECALHGAEADDDEGPRLILSEDEQRQLYERVALLNRCNEALLSRLPGTEISALGALAFLVQEAESRSVDESGGGHEEAWPEAAEGVLALLHRLRLGTRAGAGRAEGAIHLTLHGRVRAHRGPDDRA